jgi:hypothetical protein
VAGRADGDAADGTSVVGRAAGGPAVVSDAAGSTNPVGRSPLLLPVSTVAAATAMSATPANAAPAAAHQWRYHGRLPAAGDAASVTQKVQPGGGGGQVGSGLQPSGGVHPTGGSGHPGGTLKIAMVFPFARKRAGGRFQDYLNQGIHRRR